MNTINKTLFALVLLTITISVSAQKKAPKNMPTDAVEMIRKMGVGFNLGNTLEAYNQGTKDAETCWGNPHTTKEMIDSVAAAGFKSVRIPVRWYPHFTYDGKTLKIDETWMNRVKEVVGYCLDNNLNVIINTHHELWLEGHPTYADSAKVYEQFRLLWTEIANAFRDYDERVMFAGTNEVHVGNNWGRPTQENADVQNGYNRVFVNAVRATKGNNKWRNLIVQTYAANAQFGPELFKMPNDKVKNRLIAEVHSYDPYRYGLTDEVRYWGKPYEKYGSNGNDEMELEKTYQYLKSMFTDKGIPYIVGEMGSNYHSYKDEYDKKIVEASCAYYYNKVITTALKYGTAPFIWDNGVVSHRGKECFGLFDRRNHMKCMHPGVIESVKLKVESSESDPSKSPEGDLLFGSKGSNGSKGPEDKFTQEGVSWELAQHRKETIKDLAYNVGFSIPKDKNEAVEGHEIISFNLESKDDVIIDFRETKDKIHEVKTAKIGKDGKEVMNPCPYIFKNEHIIIPKEYTNVGKNEVRIDFTAGNQSLNRRDDYVYTLFVPDRARTVFPCFEQPNLKALFTLSLQIPDEWKAVTNTVENKSGEGSKEYFKDKSGYKTIQFGESEPLPTYLFAFAAGDFKYQYFDEYGLGTYYRETDPKRVAQLPEIARQVKYALDWQEKFTDVKYPFKKYDFVILPGFQFGGMEHTGATFYNDNTLFLSENPTPDEKLNRTQLISHETSHMWFGDAVTMNWFDDVWTKEVFANYFAAEITAPLFTDVDHDLNWLKTYVSAAVSQDRTDGRTSIRQPLDNMRYAGLIYNNIIYNKAPVMMRKMVNLMGKEAYQRGIQKYVKTYKYGNATWDDLINILDAETPIDLKAFSKEWVDTANWPHRKASSYKDAMDYEYYGFTEMSEQQVDSLLLDFPKKGAKAMAAMMTLHENFLAGTLDPESFMKYMYGIAIDDNDPLMGSTAISYMSEPMLLYPKFSSLEAGLWNMAQSHPQKARRTQILRLLMSNAISKEIVDSLYNMWEKNDNPLLSIRDYMSLAYELSVRMPDKANEIIAKQRTRIDNQDRLAQFDYISRAVSPSEEARDTLFASLSKAQNRRIEPWTLSVLYYLNHPLRDKQSVKYIRPALELLPEIQKTGDIFFPGNWCSYLLSGHRCEEAYKEVELFLAEHPDMLQLLRNKILQGEYYLKRAN